MSSATATGAVSAVIPELVDYMEKRLLLKINGNRQVSGVLRGYDPFMNIVLDDATDENPNTPENDRKLGMIVLRGSSIELLECQERM
ncbi:hypothetical protein IWQ62_001324 [Dispira parvispora]|uniref:Small nuclear ribonucleoprotein G n=1 Tax=Dispira parvispora TaxID=1520584 RepID=A0A9W8ASP4_9FUNG|nr:hypothetical protein IWQ62_001324 [Dispira parvispora]